MSYKTIKLEVSEAIATLTFNRPEVLNALNPEMIQEFHHAMGDVQKMTEVKVLILTGAGKAFVAGADIRVLQGFDPLEAKQFAQVGQSALFALEAMDIPVIACVNGFALGGGCEIAMACDFVCASETAQLGQPEINLGVIPGFGGTQRLVRLVGKARAKELCMTGRIITAQEAFAMGLVTRVFPAETLMDETLKIAKTIAEKGRVALRAVKHVIDNGFDVDLKTGCALEADAFSICFASPDQKEGTTAFLEKRPPKFTGKLA
ncbi:MAG: enoyl-CoA hydratase/isomerase family protein [Deltaproteobacteria bacterium]|nr:enoyl-CoA hydratase/isomerase family protein [Deltaproteobacteria bacterium]MBW2074897.1 enoyl-CoA hydratase/isomerase family protein [Deltaproteobacteria bacterium]